MSRGRSSRIALVGISIFFVFAACNDGTAPMLEAPGDASAAMYGHTLIECPVNEDAYATTTLGAKGGSLRLDRHELSLPLGAVLAPTKFELRAPVSNYMEIRIRANDEAGFKFQKPATIIIDYSRCTRSNIDKDPLSVYKIDPETKALLRNMGGIDDKAARTVTFHTDDLSTFSIAR
jgi:hypothetical protein